MKQFLCLSFTCVLLAAIAGTSFGSMMPDRAEPPASLYTSVLPVSDYVLVVVHVTAFADGRVLAEGAVFVHSESFREDRLYYARFFIGKERLYAGKPFDYSAGTYNYGYRRYDPFAARFMTLDPIRAGLNWYAYCAGDPINSVDLWGLCEKKPFQIPYASKWGYMEGSGLLESAQHIGAFTGNVLIDIGNGGLGLVNGVLGAAQNPNWSRDILDSIPRTEEEIKNGLSDAYRYVTTTPIEQIGKDFSQRAGQVFSSTDTWEKAVATGLTAAVAGAPYLKTTAPLRVAPVEADATVAISSGEKTYVTYTKSNPETGKVYSGRTSGTGTPEQIVAKRDLTHHMTDEGYGPAVVDKASTNSAAIRGREQLLIDVNGGAQSTGGTSGNAINGISRLNPLRDFYLQQAQEVF